MTTRIRQETVRFQNNFSLSGFERTQPPGSYVVEIEEELITELSFAAYRRTATVIRFPSSQLGGYHLETIDPLELNAALERDAALGSDSMVQFGHQPERAAEPKDLACSDSSPFVSFAERFKKAVSRLRLMRLM
jgi:hypothetical protein